MAFYFYLSTKIIMVFITKSYQDLFGVRSYINAQKKRDGGHLRRPAQKRQPYLCLYSCQGWLFTDNGAI